MADAEKPTPTGLALMREPFPAHLISKLPKPTKKQTEEVRNDFKKGIRCQLCGGWHHPKVVHLDYVGHAALTDRLLECDPEWNWEPVVTEGLPRSDGGMWIKLTVCGVSRLGYGSADGKSGGDAIKEIIGDALRNAAMRFGAALDLWFKGDLHIDEPEGNDNAKPAHQPEPQNGPARMTKEKSRDAFEELVQSLRETESRTEQTAWYRGNRAKVASLHEDFEALLNEEMRDRAAQHDAAKKGDSDPVGAAA